MKIHEVKTINWLIVVKLNEVKVKTFHVCVFLNWLIAVKVKVKTFLETF